MRYSYIDGSGNRYDFNDKSVKYTPMTPKFSSSGTYDGGPPFEKSLAPAKYAEIIEVFEEILSSNKDRTDLRTMGSGTLIKKEKEDSFRIYIRMNSGAMKRINSLLEIIKRQDY